MRFGMESGPRRWRWFNILVSKRGLSPATPVVPVRCSLHPIGPKSRPVRPLPVTVREGSVCLGGRFSAPDPNLALEHK